ncbi:1,4-dihydroxy-2-naphthoate polyprenyltransferase [Georgenia faecalis]|uniref:1,4-dihydroxy-2-naphthoate polyprenyltransferase n=1 Tax=Georgenia faecalis TaxID=2483799 RepID=UPI000FDC1862|nr:1,4-dihydroxy-2-naphthoate polyprenyltransferase [Georgenia faecalis]
MATFTDWVEGARLRTLPAAIAPVLVGTGAAHALGASSLPRALLAAGVALSLQVGVNFANDYSDGIRGTDAVRAGPARLTGSGAARPGAVRAAAFASFAVAGVLGLALCAVAQTWWFLAVGAVAVLAAWGYTGGKRPYGYRGLGEVAVFVFFGLVAVLGTTYTQALRVSWPALGGAVAIGLLACALIMVNNVRDTPTDSVTGKHTLAVRLGDAGARRAYVALVALPLLVGAVIALAHPGALLVLLLAPRVWRLARVVLGGAGGRDLIVVLRDTGLLELAYGVLLTVGLVL